MDYSKSQAAKIRTAFDNLSQRNVHFVVPRGYQDLPNSVPGGDVDMYVKSDDYDTAIETLKNLGFASKRITGVTKLFKKAIYNPSLAASVLVRDPQRAIDILSDQVLGGEEMHFSAYSEWKGYNDEVMFHVMDHVAYTSPMNGEMVRVDPTVEDLLFENRDTDGNVPTPSPPDELAHLLCRGVFSYEGDFPEYYIKRCEQLSQVCFNSTDYTEHLDRLLSLLFFEADTVVREDVRNGEYNNIRRDLLSYSSY